FCRSTDCLVFTCYVIYLRRVWRCFIFNNGFHWIGFITSVISGCYFYSSPPFKSISLGIVTTYFPSASVSPVAVSPLGNLIVTVVLGSASPVICASSLVTLFTIGGAGAVSSVTVVELGCETLPVASVAVALIVSLPCR